MPAREEKSMNAPHRELPMRTMTPEVWIDWTGAGPTTNSASAIRPAADRALEAAIDRAENEGLKLRAPDPVTAPSPRDGAGSWRQRPSAIIGARRIATLEASMDGGF